MDVKTTHMRKWMKVVSFSKELALILNPKKSLLSKMFLHIKTIKNIFPPYFSDQLTVGRERNGPKAYINATSSWGALRGLESFTQLIYSTKESGFKVTN